jgi:arginyl-tRNA synthetase
MIKEQLTAIVFEAISRAHAAGQIDLSFSALRSLPISIDRPRVSDHGDLSCPVAMQLAAQIVPSGNALQLAQILVSHIIARSELLGYFSRVEAVAPGFLNFDLGPGLGAEILVEIGRLAEDYGRVTGKGGEPFQPMLLSYYLPQESQALSLKQGREDTTAADLGAPNMTGIAARSNPTFLVQHAYAWCRSMLRLPTAPPINILSGQLEAPLMSLEQWETFLLDCKIKGEIYLSLDLFQNDQRSVFPHLRQFQAALILKLGSFPDQVALAEQNRQPERLARYAVDLANDLTNFSSQFNLGEGLFCADLSVLKARLGLILASRQVLGNAMGIIGMPVAEQM